ncbi:MAG: DeoR/GlpR family DNA-binding transcription regulator [Oscillospiraceae bacterium]|nr:DeoR/GlpR family DNA-binding transcription regulator [Oscillospiraceae bacterium]
MEAAGKSHEVPAFRQQKILELLEEKENIHIFDLVELCGVSQATARRDLDELARKGLIVRSHGGAVRRRMSVFEQPHMQKLGMHITEKARIAKCAAALVNDGDSIYIDSGTTAMMVGQNLTERKNLTVITHNLDFANSVMLDPSSKLIVTGGMRREDFNSLSGSIVEAFVRTIKVDKVFSGADAVDSEQGLYLSNFEELGLKRLIVECARSAILVTDHSKFLEQGIVKICDLSAFDLIITDKGLPQQDAENVLKQEVQLKLV